MSRRAFISGFVGTMVAIWISYGMNYFLGNQPFNTVPRNVNVEKGYAKPSDLEIELKDVDGNGANETLIKYKDRSYLLREDKDQRPVVQEYEVRPKEIVLGQ